MCVGARQTRAGDRSSGRRPCPEHVLQSSRIRLLAKAEAERRLRDRLGKPWIAIACLICSVDRARCSKGTSGSRRACTAPAICSARWCCSIPSTRLPSVRALADRVRGLRPDHRPLARARRHRHRSRGRRARSASAPSSPSVRIGALTLRRGFTLDRDRARARRRRRRDDGRIDARDDAGGARGGGAGGRRRVDRGPQRRRRRAALDVPLFSLLEISLPTYEPGSCPLCASGMSVMKPGSRPAAVSEEQGG